MILVANQTSYCSDSNTAFLNSNTFEGCRQSGKGVMYLSPLGVAGLKRVEQVLHSLQTCHAFIV